MNTKTKTIGGISALVLSAIMGCSSAPEQEFVIETKHANVAVESAPKTFEKQYESYMQSEAAKQEYFKTKATPEEQKTAVVEAVAKWNKGIDSADIDLSGTISAGEKAMLEQSIESNLNFFKEDMFKPEAQDAKVLYLNLKQSVDAFKTAYTLKTENPVVNLVVIMHSLAHPLERPYFGHAGAPITVTGPRDSLKAALGENYDSMKLLESIPESEDVMKKLSDGSLVYIGTDGLDALLHAQGVNVDDKGALKLKENMAQYTDSMIQNEEIDEVYGFKVKTPFTREDAQKYKVEIPQKTTAAVELDSVVPAEKVL
jgi:hypothetical protein